MFLKKKYHGICTTVLLAVKNFCVRTSETPVESARGTNTSWRRKDILNTKFTISFKH